MNTLQQTIAEAVIQPEVKKRLFDLGAQPVANTPDEFAKQVQSEVDRWRAVVKSSGIKLD